MLRLKCGLLLILSSAFLSQAALAAMPQNPLVFNNALFVSHNGIHKFNQTTLKQEWSALQGLQTFEPVMGNKLLYVGSPQGLYALDPDTGQQVWRIEEDQTIFSPNVAQQVYAGSQHGVLYSIDPANGKINWRQKFSGWVYSPVVLPDQNQLWTGGQAHQAISLSTENGHLLHTIALNQESVFSPINLHNQQIAFNLFNGKTAIINTATAQIDGWLNGSTQPKNLVFDDKLIYRSSRDGILTAFDRNSYRQKWRKPLVAMDLTMHPSSASRILMSDLDQTIVSFNAFNNTEGWRTSISGNWFSPIQIDAESIIYFHSSYLQPNKLSAVKISAQPSNKRK